MYDFKLNQNPKADRGLTENLVTLVKSKLSPVALRYGYADTSLDRLIGWKPIVLILGNYSSGKSSLVNDLLGAPLQETGQAPTDDSFTLITHKAGRTWEEVEGSAIIGSPDLPFNGFAKYGDRFAAHLKMKKIDAPVLKDIVLIDTPGMLDSISEKDRGYDYQAVVSELAALADLILVLFDPHRPGTVRETHELLRKTLPAVSYENRTVFILNRVDECENLNDLLRTYGTLCWNLSQMTGRKDIPKIFLSYREDQGYKAPFLSMLGNQREAVKNLILNAPLQRIEHLLSFTESHTKHMHYLLKIFESYGIKRRRAQLKGLAIGLALGVSAALLVFALAFFDMIPILDQGIVLWLSLSVGATSCVIWFILAQSFLMKRFHADTQANLANLAMLENQGQNDSYLVVENTAKDFLRTRKGRFSLLAVQKDIRQMQKLSKQLDSDLRQQISHD